MHITENMFAKLRKFLLAKMLEFHNIRAKRNESRKINELYNFSPSNTTEHALVNLFVCLSGCLSVCMLPYLSVCMYTCVYIILDMIQRQRTIKKSESAKTEQKEKKNIKSNIMCYVAQSLLLLLLLL